MRGIEVIAPDGIGEVTAGTDLAVLVSEAIDLADGDVVVVTSKAVSKAEGRTVAAGTGADGEAAYEKALVEETRRVVARRGRTRIVRNRLGLVMAAAGIDRSNVEVGTFVLLPDDPDASARRLRERLLELTGANVGVVVTDTAGRAWRDGQTDIAIGAAGLDPSEEFAGQVDPYGNPLEVTLPAVADEIAGAAELAQGKLGGRPLARLRGRADLVLGVGEHGPGAASLQRPEGADLFGFGAREAVVVALSGESRLHPVFGAPAAPEELAEAFARVSPGALLAPSGDAWELRTVSPLPRAALTALCVAHGWKAELAEAAPSESVSFARLSPASP
ncbi:coenzyme F420-0:L-glutamate ligase [Nocardioides jishulii]|uniref:Coenzyme F420-0:L-glutamate ligase n=1 Tax=Nocardioides jishulii TaxID=2575440 RepID=A0A4U2YIF3_9ACTN|nr:coenzyme F420-0:L-glutamate ligase [Nocardioides jishulii]QCX28212.1 coenzyme F420-0:L-glutamate ligase [Nocardioides jishulii]TKI60876.1 coenzyme F420-0:L-glutamate ligase [Nocardioides jishulii]